MSTELFGLQNKSWFNRGRTKIGGGGGVIAKKDDAEKSKWKRFEKEHYRRAVWLT